MEPQKIGIVGSWEKDVVGADVRVRKNIKVTITLPEGVENSSTHHGRRAERG